jgi:hypothetical protein
MIWIECPAEGRGCLIQTSYESWRHWYREFAERTDNPAIWDARLRTAEKLEADADRVASKPPSERWKDSS